MQLPLFQTLPAPRVNSKEVWAIQAVTVPQV